MSLFDVFDISGSAMSAQSLRMNITASNIANADSVTGKKEEAYNARQPVFSAMLDNNLRTNPSSVGVKMLGIVESKADHAMRYAPENPLANEEGYIFESNVDLSEEMVNMISASRSYQNNIEVLNTSKEMMLRTLKLGQ